MKELKRKLINKHLENWTGLKQASIEHFSKSGYASGAFLLALDEMLDEYASQFLPSSEAIKAAMNKTAEYTMEDFNVALNGGKMIESWEEFKDRIAGKLGSGVNLPLNLTIWKKAQSMNYSDFAKWFNEELKNNTPPTK